MARSTELEQLVQVIPFTETRILLCAKSGVSSTVEFSAIDCDVFLPPIFTER